MKDFCEMSADEIRNYRGPIHWARVSCISEVGTVLKIDLEHPSAELLAEHLKRLRGVQIHDQGIIDMASGNPDYRGYEGLDYPSQDEHWHRGSYEH